VSPAVERRSQRARNVVWELGVAQEAVASRTHDDIAFHRRYVSRARRARRLFEGITAPSTPYDDPTIGENPPYGASINFHLKSAPAGPAKVTILDQKGEVVRTLSAPATAGLNRVYWDLQYEPTNEIRMRTSPLIPAPQVRLGPQGWRAPGGGGATIGILAPLGTYTVRLSAGGPTSRSR
jgi:hypothetical protein